MQIKTVQKKQMKIRLQKKGDKHHFTSKYIFTQIDNLGGFTYSPSSEVKNPIKDIRMAIVEANPA